MQLMLDTHAFLWFVFGDVRLPPKSRRLIEDLNVLVYLSLGSVWEMTIKYGLGKLALQEPCQQFILRETFNNDIQIALLSTDHVFGLLTLPKEPRDPFDRIIAAQCKLDGLHLVTRDKAFEHYGVQCIWD